jgi:hypothetical protein
MATVNRSGLTSGTATPTRSILILSDWAPKRALTPRETPATGTRRSVPKFDRYHATSRRECRRQRTRRRVNGTGGTGKEG